MSRLRRALAAVGTAYGLGGVAYAAFVRPRISRWGATDEEVTFGTPRSDQRP